MSQQKQSFSDFVKKGLNKIRYFFTHHWFLKLGSLLLAVLIWAGLISSDNTLTREKYFNNVSISIVGEESIITNKGLIVVSGLDETALNAEMWVAVPQSSYKDVTAGNYNPRIDLTRLTDSGEQTLKILTSSTANIGSVTSLVPDSITVQVEEYVTNYRIPVTVRVNGDYPVGMGGNTPTADPSTASVSGPKSLVDQVSCIVVDYDISDLKEKSVLMRSALPFHFEDDDGNVIESDLLTVTSANTVLRTITVSHTVYPLQEVALSADRLVFGTPGSGYEVTNVEISPSTLLVGGDISSLERIHQLFVENAISVDDRTESFIQTVKVRKPSDINYLSTDTVAVSVQIEPVIASRDFAGIKLIANGLPNTLKVASVPKTVDVSVSGFVNDLPSLKANQISASINLAGISEAGTYTVPVSAALSGNNDQSYVLTSVPEQITVEIIDR